MALEIQEIKKVLKEPVNKGKIPLVVSHEQRLKFHSETSLSRTQMSSAANIFLAWVKTLIPKDKFAIFLSLFKFPVDTVRLTDETYQALEKVFDGRDPVYQYEFLNDETANDWDQYRHQNLNEPEVWKTKGFDVMKTAINSIMVVDLPQVQTTPNPEPYFYFLDMAMVIDFETKDDKIDWIIFRQPNDRIAVYDDENYRVFRTKDSKIVETIVDVKHDLEYCPAQFFWSTPISQKNPECKASPISNHLSQLDWILFFGTSKKFSDLYSPYTIYWGYTQDCDFEHEETGHHCDGGFLMDRDDKYIFRRDMELIPCPKCANKISGVGSFIDVPPPTDDVPAMTPPVGKVDVDVSSLDYNVKEVERLERNFYKAVTGNSLEAVNDQAINEKQVMSLFESRKQALIKLKVNFEKAQQWVDETVCRLRYGYEFVSCSINYGTEFYLFTPETILDMYISARDSNLDHMTLDMLQDHYLETKYRNNPVELQKSKILINVDPFRHATKEEVRLMFSDNHISFEDYFMKINFSSLVLKFERERGPIGEFLKNTTFNQKVEMVKSILYSYIKKPEIQE